MQVAHFSRFQNAVDSNNKRAIKSGAIAALTVEEFETAYIYFGGRCAYSGQPFSIDSNISIEHIIPLVSGGHSMAFNCIPVNGKYNSSKSGYHLLDWWKCQTDGNGKSIYNAYRLLKVLNYMIKCLEVVNLEDHSVHILTDNEIDKFLEEHKSEMNASRAGVKGKNDYKKINQLEMLRKMNMIRIEDLYSVYSELDNIKLNTAIFFEETLHELKNEIPEHIIACIQKRIENLQDLYIDGKKVFKKEMKCEDIEIRRKVLEWAEAEKLENKYGIIGYMDFEVLKAQTDVTSFLNERKTLLLNILGGIEADFNNLVNKVPNILTWLPIEERISKISKLFKLSNFCDGEKSSELYKYVISKPDLLLAGENMEILLKYVEELKIDKRLLKRGVPISTVIDNIEMAVELVNLADLNADEKIKKRVLDKIISGTTGNLLRDAYRTFRINVKEKNTELSLDEVKRDAARWIICISEKYNISNVLKPKCISKTKELYSNMTFNEEGFMKGVNPNAYIVPKIISIASLDISREAEAEIINNVFFVRQIRQGMRADLVLRDLVKSIKEDNPNMENDALMQEAARWFVFLSEASQVHLGVIFSRDVKNMYLEITKKYYSKMRFDDKGSFIDVKMPELDSFVIGIDFMKIADSYIKSKGDYYIIRGKYIKKSEIQEELYKKLSKCKNKRDVKAICIKTLKDLTANVKKEVENNIGE